MSSSGFRPSRQLNWNFEMHQPTYVAVAILCCTTEIGSSGPREPLATWLSTLERDIKANASPASRSLPTSSTFPTPLTDPRISFEFYCWLPRPVVRFQRRRRCSVCVFQPLRSLAGLARSPCALRAVRRAVWTSTRLSPGEDGWECYGYRSFRLILFDLAALCQSSLTYH